MRVCNIYACVSVFRFDCTQSCSELSPMKRNRESGRRYPNIRHPRDLCTPLFGAAACKGLQKGIPVGAAHESDRYFRPKGPSPPTTAVFNCQQRGDSYSSCGTSACFAPIQPIQPLSMYLSPRLDYAISKPSTLKLWDNYVVSLSDRGLFTRAGIFTR